MYILNGTFLKTEVDGYFGYYTNLGVYYVNYKLNTY